MGAGVRLEGTLGDVPAAGPRPDAAQGRRSAISPSSARCSRMSCSGRACWSTTMPASWPGSAAVSTRTRGSRRSGRCGDEAGHVLARQLSLRWLVSAADTFVDHPRDPSEQAAALAATLAAGAVKLSETERLDGPEDAPPRPRDPRTPLFDGMGGLRARARRHAAQPPRARDGRADRRSRGRDPASRDGAPVGGRHPPLPPRDAVGCGASTPARRRASPSSTTRPVAEHYGCMGVMAAIDAMVARAGGTVIHRHATPDDWTVDPAARRALRDADLVVVNGERQHTPFQPAGAPPRRAGRGGA